MTPLQKEMSNYKRALTRHNNEQAKGLTDMSARQTRRMYNAVKSLQRAKFRLDDITRKLSYEVQKQVWRTVRK